MAKHRRSKTARKVKGFGKISFLCSYLRLRYLRRCLSPPRYICRKSGNTVCIDAGHGGYDVGATNGERYEKDDNLRLAKAVEAELKARGINTIMTRSDDTYVSLEDRCKTANKKKADLLYHCTATVPTAAAALKYGRLKTLLRTICCSPKT